jgi:hypothetical protein
MGHAPLHSIAKRNHRWPPGEPAVAFHSRLAGALYSASVLRGRYCFSELNPEE